MVNLNILSLTLAHLHNRIGFVSHAVFVCAPPRLRLSVEIGTSPITGMDQGRIVPILRGSPPPKKR